MTVARISLISLCFLALSVGRAPAQDDAAAALAPLAEARSVCVEAPDSPACDFADGRALAIVANAIAEAGQTRDRGAFVALIRAFLDEDAPELQGAALYALAKMAPDASDTARLTGFLRAPVSALRDGAWAAAAASTDPGAALIIARFPTRPEGASYAADPAAFDPGALGLTLPAGLDYLWLSAPLREAGEVQFLSDRAPGDLLADLVAATGTAPVTLDQARADWPLAAGRLAGYGQAALFDAVQVLAFPGPQSPDGFALVYQDRLFGMTGLALVLTQPRDLTPPPVQPPPAPDLALEDPEAFSAALSAVVDVIPTAEEDETALYLAIIAAGGTGAEDYLELYPEGAYADRMRALLVAPRLVLDAVRYPETGVIRATVQNLPQGTSAELTVEARGGTGSLAYAYLPDTAAGPVDIDLSGRVTPGVYHVRAELDLPEGGDPMVLMRDFSVEQALATLSLPKTSFAPGEVMTVDFAGMAGGDQDYVATALAGSPAGSFVAYAYTGSAKAGRVDLPAPTEPGSYELRAYFNEDESILRARLAFTVAGAATAPVDVADPAAPVAPAAPLAEDDSARAVLTADAASYAPGTVISVTFSGMSGAAGDYVSVAAAGSANASYLDYAYTNGATQGVATLDAPTTPGPYELRAFFREDETILRAMLPIVVEGTAPAAAATDTPADSARAVLVPDATSYAPGATITVTYSGMSGSTSDYVSTATAGAPNASYLQYAYTNGGTEGVATLTAPTTPGDYELRAFFREDETILRAMVPFAVRQD